MKSTRDPARMAELVERLQALQPESERQWGTMTAAEMLCHLADAFASVVDAPPSQPGPRRRFIKWVALKLPVAWPRGLPAPARVDPKKGGARPTDFEADRQRVLDELARFAAAPASSLATAHGAFGVMSDEDWHRWAYRHTDHHLRQFGV